jgi:hypothetical protein
MTSPVSTLASDLCTACGLCCSGPLFNMVPVDWTDMALVHELGFPLVSDEDGPAIPFPCPRLVDKCCTVYERRPQCCRRYRCELLGRLDREETTLAEALAVVADAWQAVGLVEAELDGETIPQYRRRRAEALVDRGEALPHTPARDRLNDLDAVLDRHFRKPMQNQTIPFDEVEGRAPPSTSSGTISVSISRPSESGPPVPSPSE